jgi:hypothetical protein
VLAGKQLGNKFCGFTASIAVLTKLSNIVAGDSVKVAVLLIW